jgi:hypothetical protein
VAEPVWVSVERKGGTSDHDGLVRLALPRGLPSKQIQEARLRDKLRSIPSGDSEDRLTHGLTNATYGREPPFDGFRVPFRGTSVGHRRGLNAETTTGGIRL